MIYIFYFYANESSAVLFLFAFSLIFTVLFLIYISVLWWMFLTFSPHVTNTELEYYFYKCHALILSFQISLKKKHSPVSLQWHMHLITYHLTCDHLKLESQYFSHCWIHIISSSLNKTKKHKAFLLLTWWQITPVMNSVMTCKKQRLWWKWSCRIMSDIHLSNHQWSC